MDKIRREADRFPILARLEEMTSGRVQREHIMVAIVIALLLVAITTPVGAILTSTIGIVIPLKETLTVLRQVKRKDNEVKHIIVFWMLFSAITGIEAYVGWIIRWVPFYYAFKFAFLLWVGPLKFHGGEFVYDNFIAKIPESYYACDAPERTLDSAAKKVSEAVKKSNVDKQVHEMAEENIPKDK